MGIEPTSEAWEASILPLYDARSPNNVAKAGTRRKRVVLFPTREKPAKCRRQQGGRGQTRMSTVRQCGRSSGTRERLVAEAGGEVVVDEAGGLHEGVANGGADEAKSALEQFLAEFDGEIGLCREMFVTGPAILDRSAAHEVPDELVEGAKFFLHLEESLGVGDSGLDFETVTDDAGIAEEGARFFCVVARDFRGIETTKELAIAFALLEDGVPAEAGLRAFKDEEFEPDAIIVDGNAPFFVVVFGVEGVAGPGAAGDVLLCGHRVDSLAQSVRRVIREKTGRITTEDSEGSGGKGGFEARCRRPEVGERRALLTMTGVFASRKKRGASQGRRLWID